ncbi:uncharacterized protein N7459_003599 [Penicillium hispanicum]|uniref:uncharacterized protein n=1 Tax=Penicillium hispanicum TaxID=1080232 RepID=UPI0025416496|nr:uncharacterized protein N7459_003599 [Penicillium hispanicum]KAJ5587834.1 hypothetical protein N7459_003599 [Penicillium hispanicum]
MKARNRRLNDDWTKVIEDDTTLELGYKAAGFVQNVTVCLNADEAITRMANGDHPPCPTSPDTGSSVYQAPDNDAGFASGWCTIHFTKVQRNLHGSTKDRMNDYKNPLTDYLMSLTILDNNGDLMAHAPLQPMDVPFRVTNDSTRLNGDFTVRAADSDSGHDEFWIKDNYWKSNSDAQKCSYGKWDSSYAEGSCGFTCDASPQTTAPSVDVPSNARDAWMGNADAALTDRSTPPYTISGVKSFSSGTCSIRIFQWQQNEANEDNWHNPGTYSMQYAVWDDDNKLVAFAQQTHGAVGAQIPGGYITYCNQMKSDDSADVKCVYADKWCQVGGDFNHGYRQLDCKIACPAAS